MKENNTPVTRSCMRFRWLILRPQVLIWGLEIKFVENYFLLENSGTSKEAVSHNVLYYQPPPVTKTGLLLIIILHNYQ